MDNVSLILTVLNEERSIGRLLESILRQTGRPDEVIIVDAGSTDGTLSAIENFKRNNPSLPVVTKVVPGNRSVGRNAAIRLARNEIIAGTDAGNILDPQWLAAITAPFKDPTVDFVGGWYQPIVETPWDQSLAMVFGFRADRVNAATFLPSTRSMAFRKTLWAKVGGFDESNSHSEDTPFSIAMRKSGKKFVFAPEAVVRWHMAQGYRRLYKTFDRYALGDGQMRLWMSQYVIALAGCAIELVLLAMGFVYEYLPWLIGVLGAAAYLSMPLMNTSYKRNARSWYQIPLMKLMLVSGNVHGFVRGLLQKRRAT